MQLFNDIKKVTVLEDITLKVRYKMLHTSQLMQRGRGIGNNTLAVRPERPRYSLYYKKVDQPHFFVPG